MHRDNDGRAAEALHQPRSHNADDAGVPVLAADNQHPVTDAGGVCLQRLQCRGKHLLFRLLALGVDFGQTLGNADSLVLVPAKQQLQGHGGVVHPARRVQARGQTVADGIGGHRLAAAACALQKSVQTGAHGVL